MGLVIRQSIVTTVIAYCGVAIGYVNLLYLYPKFLEPGQIGLLRTIQDAAILFTPFAQFGLTQGIVRYYPRLVATQAQAGSFIRLILLFALAGFGIFLFIFKIFETSILAYFEANAPEIIGYTTLVLWLTFILLILVILEAYSRSLLKTIVPNLLREVVVRLLLAVLVLLYFSGHLTFPQFIIGTTIAYLVSLLILILYLWTQGDLRLSSTFNQLDKNELPGLVRFSLLSFTGMAGMIIIGKIDSIMVSGMLGLAANAIYTTSFYMATVIEIPKRALMQISMPLISRAFEKNDMNDIKNIYQKTSINQFIVGSLILVGIWANLHNLFALMPRGEIYEAGTYVVIIVGLGKLIDMLFGPSSEILVLSKYYGFNIVFILLLSAAIITGNNLLIPRYGIDGAAMGSAGALILFNFLKYFFIYAKLGMQPFTKDTLKVIGIGAIALGVNFLVPRLEGVMLDISLRSMAIIIIYVTLVFVSKASPEGNQVFKNILAKLG